jgi:hypothetical protein
MPGSAAQRSKSRGLPRWKIIPLMLLDPPSSLPRAWNTRRPFMCGSGSVRYFQSYSRLPIGSGSAAGMWMSGSNRKSE